MGQGTSIPKQFTVNQMVDTIKKATGATIPNMYPDQEFLKEHYDIIQPYRPLINYYKGIGYRQVNTFYKTGNKPSVPSQLSQNIQQLFKLDSAPTGAKFWEYFVQAMDDLYTKVKPLDHDIIVYRGVKQSTVGQNFFDGNCIMSANYPPGKKHRYCAPKEMFNFKYFSDFTNDQNVEEYVYETLGFVSTGTRFSVALNFGCTSGFYCDTIFAMRLPAGTKFIMPLTKTVDAGGKEHYSDYEAELVLFPLHNTFVVDSAGKMKYGELTTNIYYGTFCNELNVYRPPNMPKQRSTQKRSLVDIDTIKQNPSGKCTKARIEFCKLQDKICNPNTGNCVQPTIANIIKAGLIKTADKKATKGKPKTVVGKTIGKCTAQKRADCKKENKICNPDSGQCLKNTAANQSKASLAAQKHGTTVSEFTQNFL